MIITQVAHYKDIINYRKFSTKNYLFVSSIYFVVYIPDSKQQNCIEHLTRKKTVRGEAINQKDSLNQLAFYQKAGFRIVGVIPDFFTENYDEPIYENGIHCRDLIRLKYRLTSK